MGTDINCYGERRTKDGTWEALGPFTEKVYHYDEEEPVTAFYQEYNTGPYSERNYRLFAYLADVRNWYGDITPWDNPRGIPDDLSWNVQRCVDAWGDIGYSHSYYYLNELTKYAGLALIKHEENQQYCDNFFNSVFRFFNKYREEDDQDEDLRIVFFFDN